MLKPTYKDSKEDNEFEVFFLNNKELRYLEPNNFRYKGYALNPKAYKKAIPTNSIQAFTFERKYVMISAGNEIIRPRELTIENIQEINLFVKDNFPYLLENEQIFKRNLKIENKLFINKFLLSSPFIIFSIAIYFFADNGKDKTLTIIFIICMFALLFIIYIVLKRK